MAQTNKKTELILYSRTPYSLGQEDVILFDSNEQRDEYFSLGNANSELIYRSNNYNYVEDRGTLNVSVRKGDILKASYMRFHNEDEDVTYYCFILDLIYENEQTTQIVFEVDVAMTYLTELLQGVQGRSATQIGGFVEQATQKRKINGEYNIVDTAQGFNVGDRKTARTTEFNNELLWLVVVSKPSIQLSSDDTGKNSPGFPATFKNFRYFIIPVSLNAYSTITTIINGNQYNSVTVSAIMKSITNSFGGDGTTNTVNQTVNVYTTRHCGVNYTYTDGIVTINEPVGIIPRGLGGTAFSNDPNTLTEAGTGELDTNVNWSSDLTYNGRTFTQDMVRRLIALCRQHKILPIGPICQAWVESSWGNSNVAIQNNNWSGITWTGNPNRPSGITVSQGTARPGSEGGYYNRYASTEDWLSDFLYLLRSGGNYVVSGKTIISEYTRGLFKVGGAKYDYASSGYNHYNTLMTSAYNGIVGENTLAVIQSINALVFSNGTWFTNSSLQNNIGVTTLNKEIGSKIGNGTDYALVAEYTGANGGAYMDKGTKYYPADTIEGEDIENEYNIPYAYEWEDYDFTVTENPTIDEIKIGDIVVIEPNNSTWGTGESGGAFVIGGKENDQITIYEQAENIGFAYTEQTTLVDDGIIAVISPPTEEPDQPDIEDGIIG